MCENNDFEIENTFKNLFKKNGHWNQKFFTYVVVIVAFKADCLTRELGL